MDTLHKILYLIKKNGFTELQFTQKINLNKSAVSDWKSGKTSSYNKHLPKIAEILGVSIDDLLDSSKPINENQKQQDNLCLDKDEIYFLLEYRRLPPRKKTILIGKLYELVDSI